METKEDVNTATAADGKSSEAVKVDDKGVPLENRVKEYERKLAQTQQEMEALRARLAEREQAAEPQEDPAELKKKKLMELVEDPEQWFEQRLTAKQRQAELAEVRELLQKQPEDARARIIEIEREYGLSGSPKQVAQAAMRIFKNEQIEKEFGEHTRETKVTQSMPEGSGRATPVTKGPKRAELITQLKEAAKRGDTMRQASILNMLEDVRE